MNRKYFVIGLVAVLVVVAGVVVLVRSTGDQQDEGAPSADPSIGALKAGDGVGEGRCPESTVQHFQSFATTWVVPPQPTSAPKGYVYYWNGINRGAIQPVLAWRSQHGRQGKYTLETWWLEDKKYHHDGSVEVQPGQRITAEIHLVKHDDDGWTYEESFVGYPATSKTITVPKESDNIILCVEPGKGASFPDVPLILMSDIKLTMQPGVALPKTITWEHITNAVSPPTAQRAEQILQQAHGTVVVNNSATDGEVALSLKPGVPIKARGGH